MMRPRPRPRALLAAAVCAAVLLVPALPARASSPVLRRIRSRIVQAERQTLRWDGRLNHWQDRVSGAATRLDRLVGQAASAAGIKVHERPRIPGIYRPTPDPIAQAQAALHRALDDPSGHEAKEQATEWRRYMLRLKAAERAVRAAGRGAGVAKLPTGPVTYSTWSRAFLASLKAPACKANMRVVVAWETAESTLARYNPLATEYGILGGTAANAAGVRNFDSFAQGIVATRNTLLADPGSLNYVNIVDDLLSCAHAHKTATAIWASAWCSGCAKGAYVLNRLNAVETDWPAYASRLVSTY